MSSAFASVEAGHDEITERVTLDLPKRAKNWLERKALERKQSGVGRMAMSPIVAELIEREIEREEGPSK